MAEGSQEPPPPPPPPPQHYYGQQSPWASTYHWTPAEPDNTSATVGFILSLGSLGLLIMSFGLLSPVNLCLSIAAIFASRSGLKKVERGETTKNEDLGRWGFWLGIVGAALSLLVIAAFVALIVSAPGWIDEIEPDEPR